MLHVESENTLRGLKEILVLKHDPGTTSGPLSPPFKDLVLASGRYQAVPFRLGAVRMLI